MEQSKLENTAEQTVPETDAQEAENPAAAPEPAKEAEDAADVVETETPEEPAEEETFSGKVLFNDIMDILETVLVSMFVILLVFGYCMRPVTVEGRSMVPTLHDQDRLVMYRLFYKPHVGDIVVINDQEGHVLDENGEVVLSGYSLNEYIIKRVIAVGGQTIRIDASLGEVYVDGVKLDEPYVNELTFSDDRAFTYPLTIPEGYIFVMGDNRNRSTDSRSSSVGLVSTADVMGKAYFRYYAAEPGQGDDSEKGTFGFVK